MPATQFQAVTDSFAQFSSVARRYMHIRNKADYLKTLDLIETLMSEADDSHADSANDLIDLLARSVEAYEDRQDAIKSFHHQASGLDAATSTLRLLMQQHALGVASFSDEIGSKSLVSMILSGQRALTKDHITKLAQRFNVSPALFFAQQERAANWG